MRTTFARILRKWADLIDPRVGPKDEISIRINVDTTDALKNLELVENVVKRSLAASDSLKSRRPRS